MQKLCTAGLTGDGRGHHHHTFAPVDLTAPNVAAGKNAATVLESLPPMIVREVGKLFCQMFMYAKSPADVC